MEKTQDIRYNLDRISVNPISLRTYVIKYLQYIDYSRFKVLILADFFNSYIVFDHHGPCKFLPPCPGASLAMFHIMLQMQLRIDRHAGKRIFYLWYSFVGLQTGQYKTASGILFKRTAWFVILNNVLGHPSSHSHQDLPKVTLFKNNIPSQKCLHADRTLLINTFPDCHAKRICCELTY